ncbi:MAG: DUF456 domain-containing protein [Planctomycetes bacterium]|nr:DUF456 domain-containing protein [Planctomycetota bacterium]
MVRDSYNTLMEIAVALVSIIWVWISFLIIPFGLPGNWLMVAAGFVPLSSLGYTPLIIMLAAAVIAELSEMILGSKMAHNAGASKSGMVGAFVGAFFGGLFLTFLIPVPVVGTVVGACLGAFIGAIGFEIVFAKRNATSASLAQIGIGASIGVLLGRVVKLSLGAAVAIYWTLTAINTIFL